MPEMWPDPDVRAGKPREREQRPGGTGVRRERRAEGIESREESAGGTNTMGTNGPPS